MSSSTTFSIGLPNVPSRRSAARPSPGRTRSTAVATYRHSRPGSLSPASSVIQARADPSAAHQERTAVVFPYPGGAATSVTGSSPPASIVRDTRPIDDARAQTRRGELGLDEQWRGFRGLVVAARVGPLPEIRSHCAYRRIIATLPMPGDGFAITRVIAGLRADCGP